jgi:hypothetical protein
MPPSSPTFGKRNRTPPRPAPSIPAAVAVADQAAFFATARRDVEETDERPRIVPRSFRAALLAGLVVGFCLAGLDVTHGVATDAALDPLLKASGLLGDVEKALPWMIALSLLSGARTAAATLLISHRLLAWAGQSTHFAYAAGGAAVAAVYAALVGALGHPSHHGWIIDLAAGAGAGFFYRMFAGAKRV